MRAIPIGSDHTLQLTIRGTNTVPIDLGNCENLTVKLRSKGGEILATYSLADSTVTIVSAENGRADVYLLRSQLTVLGELYADIIIDITNSNFEDGYKRTQITELLGELV